jgi:hypothetical protein
VNGVLLCRRPKHRDRWVGLGGHKVLCATCSPPVVAHQRARLRDYALEDVLRAVDEAREQVRAAIRLGQVDGAPLARLLGPMAEVGFLVKRGNFGVAKSKGRLAVERVRAAAEDAPTDVREALLAAASTLEAVMG